MHIRLTQVRLCQDSLGRVLILRYFLCRDKLDEDIDPALSGWQNFLACLALHMMLPLLPLLLEWWFSGKIESKSAALTTALYLMAIGLSSRHVAMFSFCILLGFLFSAASGYLSTTAGLGYAKEISCVTIVFVFISHIIERYIRHVKKKRLFFEFLKDD